jgi:hypothetical protein
MHTQIDRTKTHTNEPRTKTDLGKNPEGTTWHPERIRTGIEEEQTHAS